MNTGNSLALNTTTASAVVTKPEVQHRRAERRAAHRVPCRVRASSSGNGKGITAVGQTVNLSTSGLAIQLGCPMDAGTPVEVLLPHLDGEPTRLRGRVAHTRRVVTGTFEIGIAIDPEVESG